MKLRAHSVPGEPDDKRGFPEFNGSFPGVFIQPCSLIPVTYLALPGNRCADRGKPHYHYLSSSICSSGNLQQQQRNAAECIAEIRVCVSPDRILFSEPVFPILYPFSLHEPDQQTVHRDRILPGNNGTRAPEESGPLPRARAGHYISLSHIPAPGSFLSSPLGREILLTSGTRDRPQPIGTGT